MTPKTRDSLVASACGLLFGIGLGISGMTQPSKVIGFLNVTEGLASWDPSLVFVMIGAVFVNSIAYLLIRRRGATLLGKPLELPTKPNIDRRLIVGAGLFGIGWGLGGFCPGPGLVSLASLDASAILFVFAMSVGMVLHQSWASSRTAA